MLDTSPASSVTFLDPPAPHGERLTREDYRRDFRRRRREAGGRSSWKFERRQHFEEQGDPSRDALRRGHWAEALMLLEEERGGLLRSAETQQRQGLGVFHRVRVVEEPLTPYMQWELHALRVQAECGKPVRVVPAQQVSGWEDAGLLPEMIVLGGRTLYEVQYTEAGVPDGAVRFTDDHCVERWAGFVRELYDSGEDVRSYVEREVAHLPPPVPAQPVE